MDAFVVKLGTSLALGVTEQRDDLAALYGLQA